jgi:hypothetical protein
VSNPAPTQQQNAGGISPALSRAASTSPNLGRTRQQTGSVVQTASADTGGGGVNFSLSLTAPDQAPAALHRGATVQNSSVPNIAVKAGPGQDTTTGADRGSFWVVDNKAFCSSFRNYFVLAATMDELTQFIEGCLSTEHHFASKKLMKMAVGPI